MPDPVARRDADVDSATAVTVAVSTTIDAQLPRLRPPFRSGNHVSPRCSRYTSWHGNGALDRDSAESVQDSLQRDRYLLRMNLSQLHYLVAAADHPTMTAAAQALHVSQPVLSRAIRSFEREIGVQVFAKSGRNVTVTPAGVAVIEAARSSLEALAPLQALADGAFAATGPAGGDDVHPRHEPWPAGRRVTAIRADALHVRFIRANDIPDVFGIVLSGRADVGLSDIEPTQPLCWQPVGTSEPVLVCPVPTTCLIPSR